MGSIVGEAERKETLTTWRAREGCTDKVTLGRGSKRRGGKGPRSGEQRERSGGWGSGPGVTISYDDPKIKPDLLQGCSQADERDTWGPGGCSLWMVMEMMVQRELGHRQPGETLISQPGPSGWWLRRTPCARS